MNPINPPNYSDLPNYINPSISCPKCRGIDIIKHSETSFSCRTCGSEIILYNGQDISEMYNGPSESSKKPDRDFITGSRVTEKFTTEEFKRATYEFLRDSERVPSYVFNEFHCDNIMIYDIPLMKLEGKSEVCYSRTLGFDKDEVYPTAEIRYDSKGKRHVNYYSSTRKVTDWQQDNGVLHGETELTEVNMDTTDYDGLTNEIDLIDYSTMVPLTEYELNYFKLNQNKLKISKKKMIDKIYEKQLPQAGNYCKNEHHDGITEITNSSLIIVKVYSMVIHLRNLKAIFYSMASGRLNVYMTGEFPKEDDENKFQKQLKTLEMKQRILMRLSKIMAVISIIIGIIWPWYEALKPNGVIFRKTYTKKINNTIERRKEKIINIKHEAFNKIT